MLHSPGFRAPSSAAAVIWSQREDDLFSVLELDVGVQSGGSAE